MVASGYLLDVPWYHLKITNLETLGTEILDGFRIQDRIIMLGNALWKHQRNECLYE